KALIASWAIFFPSDREKNLASQAFLVGVSTPIGSIFSRTRCAAESCNASGPKSSAWLFAKPIASKPARRSNRADYAGARNAYRFVEPPRFEIVHSKFAAANDA